MKFVSNAQMRRFAQQQHEIQIRKAIRAAQAPEGVVPCPKGIHPPRWKAMVRQILVNGAPLS